MCKRNKVWESLRIFFFCGGNPLWIWERRPDNTHDTFAWVTRRSLPSLERPVDLSSLLERPVDFSPSLERPVDLCLQSRFTDLILSFQVPYGSVNILFVSRIFLFVDGYQNLHTSVFFPVICGSYLRTEIYVIQSIGNNSYPLSCKTTLLMLSCDRIESA